MPFQFHSRYPVHRSLLLLSLNLQLYPDRMRVSSQNPGPLIPQTNFNWLSVPLLAGKKVSEFNYSSPNPQHRQSSTGYVPYQSIAVQGVQWSVYTPDWLHWISAFLLRQLDSYLYIFRSVSTTHHCQERSPLVLCPDPDAEWKQLLVVDGGGGGGFNQQQYRMWTFNLFTINGTEEDQHEELRWNYLFRPEARTRTGIGTRTSTRIFTFLCNGWLVGWSVGSLGNALLLWRTPWVGVSRWTEV